MRLHTWLVRTALATATLASATPGHCFGDDGHRIVGEIAWHYLTPHAASEVTKLLTDSGYTTLPEAATWADTHARNVPGYDFARPFHYVNVAPHLGHYDEARDCPNACVVTAITRYRAVLESPREVPESPFRRREALYFLAHFVGDIHQPLHVAHPDNKGGNLTEVRFFGTQKNAHWVWDIGLFERAFPLLPAFEGVKPENFADVAYGLRVQIESWERTAWQKDLNPEHWADETLAVAQVAAYMKKGQRVDDAYVQKSWSVIGKQLQKAGVRLAAVLNAAFAKTREP